MQVTIPDDLQIQTHAITAGFASVEKYIQHLVEEDLGLPKKTEAVTEEKGQVPYSEWKNLFDDFIATLEPGNPDADYSRESIYADRMDQLNPHADSH